MTIGRSLHGAGLPQAKRVQIARGMKIEEKKARAKIEEKKARARHLAGVAQAGSK